MSSGSFGTGQLFSRLYLEKGPPTQDGERFRARLGAHINRTPFDRRNAARTVLLELGSQVPITSQYTLGDFQRYVARCSARDMLDVITIIYQHIQSSNQPRSEAMYRDFVSRAFVEENMSYRLDNKCGVHFFRDEEFERSRVSTIGGLEGENRRAAREAFEDAHRALLNNDTLTAVRRSFDGVESVFKQRFSVSRLGATEIKSQLTPVLQASSSGRVLNAANRIVATMSEWTNSVHQFRHAPGEADPSPPPLEMAILLVSEASAFCRWLIDLPAN